MSDIQQYLLDYDRNKNEASATAQKSATRLSEGNLKLLTLIEELGEYLNSEDGATRSKTMAFLAEVLALVPPKVLSLQQRNLLCEFLLSRTEDNEGLGSCAKGLIALEERGKWDAGTVQNIIETLLANTTPLKAHSKQSDRYSVLRLVDILVAKYRDALHDLHESSSDFLSRFIAYFDGEKDPRNLMMVFSILKVPMTEWSIGADAQDLFEAVFNYFPITFRPPPNDPYGITAQDLKDRLRECIASSSEFAPYAFPALLEKLDTQHANTKHDVLQTIISAATEYGPRTMSLYSITLWDALKYEVLSSPPPPEDSLAEEALEGLAAIARTLSRGTEGPLNAYLKPIIKECNEHLEDAPTKQSQAAASILHKIATVSPEVINALLAGVLPRLFTLYQAAETMAKRRGLLEVFVQLIKADIEVYGDWRSVGTAGEQSGSNALIQLREQALGTLLSGLETAPVSGVSFRLVCLDGLVQLSKTRGLLTDEDIGKIIQLLHNIVINEQSFGKDETKEAAINGLVEVAHQKPQVVIDKAFPAFMAQLPDTDADGAQGHLTVLEAFAKFANEEKVFNTVMLRLKNKFSSAVSQNASSAYIVALLSAMLYAFSRGVNKLEQNSQSMYYEDIALPLLKRTSSTDASHPKAFDDATTLDLVGRICNMAVKSQVAEHQQEIADQLFVLFRDTPQSELPPFNLNASSELNKTMVVSTHLLASLRKETRLPCEIELLISSLANYTQQTSLSPPVRSASLRQLSLVINKFYTASELKTCLDPLINAPFELFNPEKLDPLRIRLVFACLKGILLRSSPVLAKLYPPLLEFLSHPKYGTIVAHGFSTLLQPDDLLTKENYCQISGLHKQKSFALLVPNITESFRQASPETKSNYLIALSGVLKWMPFDIIMEEVDKLVLLLLQSLDLKGEDLVKEATVATLTSTLTERSNVLEEHVGSLITRLLANSVAGGEMSAPPRVRAAALKCLALVPDQLKLEVVLPYRRQVCKKLTPALDDRKREVRTAAVKCRARWLEVDEVEDDD
ncbi:hypothetical protein DM02DRAFT_511273 [Periconia macrospinosa]|uniref:MMS19 nucleotide excision repair protein n=1 Tax=Periconia macrospinosa TaxID=97972 RepID=A0A2V1EFU0_9PLEO|nr:hypothetical protein DM02DRAFT_511273 [Periconia macrospinosa]